ncbi:MAG: hypothetical protein IPK67_12140 [Planctomycetes bacterium]|nr:hypothetical protein [Planctomycetota bacterium]
MSKLLASALALATVMTASAAAQVPFFNVDLGANVNYPAPGAGYSAATTQAGFWNARSAANANGTLTDINGSPRRSTPRSPGNWWTTSSTTGPPWGAATTRS